MDSRFFIQAARQLEGTGIEMMKLRVEGTPSIPQWIKEHLSEDDIVAMDEDLFSYSEYQSMLDSLSPLNVTLVEDPFDRVWRDRPALQFNPVRFVPVSVSGESVTSKHRRLVENEAMTALLKEGVILKDYEEFGRFLKALPKDCVRIFSSGKITAKYFFAAMDNIHQHSPFRPYVPDPTPGGTLNMMKAVKNATEIEGYRRAFVEDARALMKVIDWVKENADKGITEYQVAMKLIEVRSECPDYLGESFPAIVGFGANAALPHYVPTEEESAVIRPEGFLLIDTGAQYTYGTTDTTRTIPLGPLTQVQKDDYTVALKGMIDLSMAVFYKGMRGCLLDILARGPIMKAGRNMLVDEDGRLSRTARRAIAGLMTLAPSEGEYGIRHENAVLVVSHEKNGYGEFLAFETLTVTPIDLTPVNFDLLGKEETAWIMEFNRRAEAL